MKMKKRIFLVILLIIFIGLIHSNCYAEIFKYENYIAPNNMNKEYPKPATGVDLLKYDNDDEKNARGNGTYWDTREWFAAYGYLEGLAVNPKEANEIEAKVGVITGSKTVDFGRDKYVGDQLTYVIEFSGSYRRLYDKKHNSIDFKSKH